MIYLILFILGFFIGNLIESFLQQANQLKKIEEQLEILEAKLEEKSNGGKHD